MAEMQLCEVLGKKNNSRSSVQLCSQPTLPREERIRAEEGAVGKSELFSLAGAGSEAAAFGAVSIFLSTCW